MIATGLLASETGHKYSKVNFVVVCSIYSILWFSMYMYMYHMHKLAFQELICWRLNESYIRYILTVLLIEIALANLFQQTAFCSAVPNTTTVQGFL